MAGSPIRVVLSGAAAGAYGVTRAQPLTVGRAGRARVYDLAASRLHCRVELTENGRGLKLVDLHSTNGTYLNGERVEGCRPLQDGDEIRIGTSALRVHVEIARPESGKAELACAQCGAALSSSSFAGAGAFERAGHLYCGLCGTRPSVKVPVLDDESLLVTLGQAGFREIERLPLECSETFYAARRAPLGQPVTLRVLDTEGAPKAKTDAFLREARTAARLSHPNVARVIDVGSFGNLLYMVLERIEGRTLAGEIASRQRLPARRALAVALPLARALAYMHEHRVLHRDLRPENVVVGSEGETKLIGFGSARALRDLGASDDEEVHAASLPYRAPEMRGSSAAASERSDIYSLGATLFHAITGAPPEPASVKRDLDATAPELAEPIRALVLRCLETSPERRFATARELVAVVEEAVRDLYGFERGPIEAVGVLVNFGPSEVLSDTTRRTMSEGLPRDDAEGSALFGRFAGSELVELAQLIDLNAKSGVLEVISQHAERGTVLLRRGRAIQARFRHLTAEDALLAIFQLEAGQFRLMIGDPTPEAEHDLLLSPFLLEAMRRQDESARLPVVPA